MKRLKRNVFFWVALLGATLFLTGCQTGVNMQLDSSVVYKRDLSMRAGGTKHEGVVVAKQPSGVDQDGNPYYEIRMKTKGDFSLLVITTCHRSIEVEKEETFYAFNYHPIPGLETGQPCPMVITGYDAKKGKHAFGFIDFEGLVPDEKLPAKLTCNGEIFDGTVTACQNKTDLISQIEFQVPVNVSPDPGCEIPPSDDKKKFVFPTRKDHCGYLFKEIGKENYHRLTVIGYEEYPVRQ